MTDIKGMKTIIKTIAITFIGIVVLTSCSNKPVPGPTDYSLGKTTYASPEATPTLEYENTTPRLGDCVSSGMKSKIVPCSSSAARFVISKQKGYSECPLTTKAILNYSGIDYCLSENNFENNSHANEIDKGGPTESDFKEALEISIQQSISDFIDEINKKIDDCNSSFYRDDTFSSGTRCDLTNSYIGLLSGSNAEYDITVGSASINSNYATWIVGSSKYNTSCNIRVDIKTSQKTVRCI